MLFEVANLTIFFYLQTNKLFYLYKRILMKFKSLFTLFCCSLLLLTSCKEAYKITINGPKKATYNSVVQYTVTEANNQAIDSVQFFVNGTSVPAKNASFDLNTSTIGLGKHAISALVFYPGKTKKENSTLEVFAQNKPVIYNFNIVNTYPHDTKAYTQGLEYHDGFLYESTGRKGQSTLRKVDLTTGKVLRKTALPDRYFGEGMTIYNDTIFFLTWQAKKGFMYDLQSFKQIGEFNFNKSKEGWGLTHNATHLIKSDGTHKIWFLDPKTQEERYAIQVYTNDRAVKELNELEYINGKIYANKWQQNALVIIDAKTGAVTGVANLNGLKELVEKEQKLEPQDDVLNGIAYDAEHNRLFVTGKNWGKLFEIELTQKQ